MHIYKLKDIDLDRVTYSKPKGKADKQVIMLMYDDPVKGKRPLIFQTPELKNVNKLGKSVSKDTGLVYYDLDVPLYTDNRQNQSKVASFTEFLRRLDAKFMEDGKKNASKWFAGKENVRYKSVIRRSTVEDEVHKNGLMRLKLVKSSDFTTLVFNEDKDPVNPETNIRENSYVVAIVELLAIWINKDGGYGSTIRVNQVQVKNKRPTQYSFIEDSDDDDCPDDLCGDTEIDPTATIGLKSKESERTKEKIAENVAQLTELPQESTEKEIVIVEPKNESKGKCERECDNVQCDKGRCERECDAQCDKEKCEAKCERECDKPKQEVQTASN